MATLKLTGAYLPLEMDPGPKALDFEFEAGTDLTGTWVGKVRDERGSASTALDFSAGIAASGTTMVVTLTEAQLLALIPADEDVYRGWYAIDLDDNVYFYGPFVVNQKASR